MVDGDAGAQSPVPSDAHRRKRALLWAGLGALLLVSLGLGVGAVAFGGGDDDESKVAVADKKVVSTSTPTTKAAVTATTTQAKTTVTTAASRSGGATATTLRTTASTTAPKTAPTTAPPPTTTTLKPIGSAPPQFVTASASPSRVVCPSQRSIITVTIAWVTTDATGVNVVGDHYQNTGVNPNSSIGYEYVCGVDATYVHLTAVGPGGQAVMQVSWTYTIR